MAADERVTGFVEQRARAWQALCAHGCGGDERACPHWKGAVREALTEAARVAWEVHGSDEGTAYSVIPFAFHNGPGKLSGNPSFFAGYKGASEEIARQIERLRDE